MKSAAACVATCLGLLLAGPQAFAADERPEARAWAAAAIFGEEPAKVAATPGIEVRRQDYGVLRVNQSVMRTPLKIGEKAYPRGLGTHAVSEILVRLPGPGRRFEAQAGIDNNYDTAASKGSVVFAVEVAGKEAFKSGLRRGGEAPLPVGVDLGGAKEFVLRVFDGGDGPGWDQSDWAEASVMLENGERIWLDEMAAVTPGTGFARTVPFSFTYGGKTLAQLAPAWKRTHAKPEAKDGRERHVVTYTDGETGLEVSAEVTLFEKYPAIEWVLRLRNTGTKDTPLIENILPLDLRIQPPDDANPILHYANGSTCGPTDFLPIDQPVPAGTRIDLAPAGGRSSDGRLPFFNLEWAGGGVVGAIGWSGQWAMSLERDKAGSMALRAGQQETHLVLHPGEAIRTPRILLVMWQGADRFHGHNLLRRILVDHYVPRLAGEPVLPPIAHNTWFTYNSGNDVTEANQLEAIRLMAPTGAEVYWLDAGWFEGGWPSGVGSWTPRADAFPRGLKPLSEAAHKAGMKFIVWFEPERVHPQSDIGKEHPEFVLRTGRGGDGLFNLGDPAARQWLTDLLSKAVTDGGIDLYRNDFNIDPLPFWQKADTPNRRGMAEIRYVEGLYQMWDDLRARHAGLWIDNCASGGRRIDLETTSRSLPLWQSDTQCCGRAEPIQDQVQMAGLNLYVPLHAGGCWGFDPYVFRSVATTGTNLCPDARQATFPAALAKAAIAEAKSLRPFYLGDYYPLTSISLDETHWCGWQLDRPDLGKGCAVLLRRPKSPYTALDATLHGLDPAATYEVTFAEGYEPGPAKRMSGKDLARLRVEIGQAPGSVVVRYGKVK